MQLLHPHHSTTNNPDSPTCGIMIVGCRGQTFNVGQGIGYRQMEARP